MKKTTTLIFAILMAFSIYGQKVGTTYTPVVSQAVYHDISQPLSEVAIQPLGLDAHHQWKNNVVENKFHDKILKKTSGTLPIGNDPAWQKTNGSKVLTTPIQNFEGTRNSDNGSGLAPPDTDGDVGPNHYFQMCNVIFQIFDKNGNTLLGPLDNSTIWDGFIGPWTGTNDGDPIVLYDEQADRWLVSQFAVNTGGNYYELVAISTTSDPTGSYYRYAFQFSSFPDYPKFGIWRDGYYLMVQHGTAGGDVTAAALERSQMLIGGVADMVQFAMPNLPGGGFIGMLPSDNDGDWAPVGTPNYFAYFSDDAWGDDPVDRLKIWEFDVNWTTPALSTLALTQNLDTDPFDSYFGTFTQAFIGQPVTAQNLSALEGALMNRMQYRNFGTYETMVLCHTVDLDNGPTAGTRWYELRKPSGGSWSIYQQGTYAPGADNYWMASIAMNGNGDIALGYSVSSETTYPSIRYTGRFADDPLGTMTFAEGTIIAGSNYQNGTRRWGDYSMMSVDPVDDRTFWYTNEYLGGNNWSDWVTQIASFSITEYCHAGSFTCDEHISNVQIGTINNASGCDNYRDYTAFSTDVPINFPQNITVTNGSLFYPDDQCGIWVDWNRDGDFYDAAEAIAVSGTPGVGPYNATIAVPAGTSLGECTMRIRITYTGLVDPCGVTSYGEVEDYTIVVAPAVPNTWVGTSNNNWHNNANWTLGHFPVAGEDVVINNVGFQPVRVNTNNETCDNLTINPGVNFEIYGYSLDVAGTLDNNGTIKFLNAAANVTAVGFSNIGGTVQMDNGNFTVTALTDNGLYGTWIINNGSAMLSHTTGFADLNATVNMSGGLLSITQLTSNSIWGYSSPANVTMSGGILEFNCIGIDLSSFYPFTENITGGTIRTNGYLYIDSPDFTPTGGSIKLFGPNDATIYQAAGSIINLDIDKGGVKSSNILPETWKDRNDNTMMMAPLANSSYPLSTLDIAGDLTITSGTFSLSGQTVNASNVYVYGTLQMNDALDILNVGNWLWFYPGSTGTFTDGVTNMDFALWLDPGCNFNTIAPNVINLNGSGLHGIVGYEPASIATLNFLNTTGLGSMEECVDLNIDNLNIIANVAVRSWEGSNITINNYSDGVGSTFSHVGSDKSSSFSLTSPTITSPSSSPKAIPTTIFNNDVLINGTFDVASSIVTANAKFETASTGEFIVSGGMLLCNVDISSGWNVLGGQTTLSSGSIEFPLSNLQMYSSTISGGTIVAGRTFYTPAASTFMPTGGTVELVGSGGGHYLNVNSSAGNFFNNLTVNRSTSIGTNSATPIRINGNILINSGAIAGNNNTISVGGNWTNNVGPGGFIPGTSTVIFNQDGGIQEVSGENIFNNVQQDLVGAGSNLQFMGSTTILGDLTLNHFAWINDLFDVQGILNLNNPASKFTANIGGMGTIANLSQGGTVVANGGTIDFLDLVEPGIYGIVNVDNGTLNYFQDALQFPDVNAAIDISGGVLNYTAGSAGCWIAYDGPASITMSGGEFNFINGYVGVYEGDPFTENITGGVISIDLIFEAQHTAFTPTGGTVRLNGGNDGGLSMTPGANFFNVEINKSGGKSTSLQYNDRFENLINGVKANTIGLGSDIDVIGDFAVNAGLFNMNNYTANVSGNTIVNTGGTLSVDAGGTLAMGSGSAINVNSGGTLLTTGVSGFPATVTGIGGTGYYDFWINSGGTMGAEYAIFEYMTINGVFLRPGSIVDPVYTFNYCTFRNGTIGYATLFNIATDQSFTSIGANFPDVSSSQFNTYKYLGSTGQTTFLDAVGALAGSEFEFDEPNGIHWTRVPYELDLQVFLEGPYNTSTNLMNLDLYSGGYIPLGQPYYPALPYYGNPSPIWLYPGFESVGTIPPNVVDWIVVQLRDASTPGGASSARILETRAGFILNDGSVVDLDGVSNMVFDKAIFDNLFVVLYHRNHLGTMSNFGLIETAGVFSYNYSTGINQVYGGANGHKEIEPGVWGMVAADGDANGTVQLGDKNVAWFFDFGGSGYLGGDFDMNAVGQLTDKNIQWLNNLGTGGQIPAKGVDSNTGYSSQVPK